jgi:hypothetical protein
LTGVRPLLHCSRGSREQKVIVPTAVGPLAVWDVRLEADGPTLTTLNNADPHWSVCEGRNRSAVPADCKPGTKALVFI